MLGIINGPVLPSIYLAVVPRSLFRSFLSFVARPKMADAACLERKKGGRKEVEAPQSGLTRHIDVLRQPASVRADAL